VGHPQIGLDATKYRGRLDEFVERHVIAKPSAVAVNDEHASGLPVDSSDELVQVPVQVGVGISTAEQRECQFRRPNVHLRCGGDDEVDRLLGIVDGD
jgi:hypothetical protein